MTEKELGSVWQKLTNWATDKQESKIVRVDSIQGLSNLLKQRSELVQDFNLTLAEIKKDRIHSINARIKRIKNASR